MSDWSDEDPVPKKSKSKAKKQVVSDDGWSSDEKPKKPAKSTAKPKKQPVEEAWSEDEAPPKKPQKPQKSSKPTKSQIDAEGWSDDFSNVPVKQQPEKVKKPAKKQVQEEVWSSEEEKPKPKKAQKPAKKPVESDFSDEEPAPPKKSQKPAKKPVKNDDDDWSEDEKPQKKSSKPAKKPTKKVEEEDWSEEEKPKPKKKPSKKPVESDFSDEEPAPPKKPQKPAKKPVKNDDDWSEDEKPQKKPSKPAKKPTKNVEEEDWSEEEKPKKKPEPKKSAKAKAQEKEGWSDDESAFVEKTKPAKKKQEETWSDDEEEVEKPKPKPQSKPKAKKPEPIKEVSEAEADFSDEEEEEKPKPKPKSKPAKKAESDFDNDSDDDAFGASDNRNKKQSHKSKKQGSDDEGSEKSFGAGSENGEEREPVTYVPEYWADEDDNLYDHTISAGIDFEKYDKIEVKVSNSSNQNTTKYSFHNWDEADLDEQILYKIKKQLKWSKPTPIQKHTLKLIQGRKDVMACAQTGSGKTGAFALPIIANLMNDEGGDDGGSDDESDNGKICCRPKALIVAPTRELVQQITRSFVQLGKDIVTTNYVVGGHAVRSQLERIEGSDIIVATPGRLNDFVGKRKIVLDKLQYLVLDEADRMMEMGFNEILTELALKMKDQSERQTSLFSATFPDEVQKICKEFLKDDYYFVTVGKVGACATSVQQKFIEIESGMSKEDELKNLIAEVPETKERTVIFVETKRMADFWAAKLSEEDIPATSIHGDRQQAERELALHTFKMGEFPILVATNVAARGIDIPGIQHVINYDLPKEMDEYVHRIGRTGRVGHTGRSTSFYNQRFDETKAKDIKALLEGSQQEVPEFIIRDCGSDEVSPSMVTANPNADDDDDEDEW